MVHLDKRIQSHVDEALTRHMDEVLTKLASDSEKRELGEAKRMQSLLTVVNKSINESLPSRLGDVVSIYIYIYITLKSIYNKCTSS
jgi:hypothetical protein